MPNNNPSLIDYDAMRFWLDCVQWICMLLILAFSWFRTRAQATDQRVTTVVKELSNLVRVLEKDLSCRITATESRIAVTEEQIKAGPNQESISTKIGRVHGRLDDTNKELSRLTGEITGLRATLQTMHEVMLGRKL